MIGGVRYKTSSHLLQQQVVSGGEAETVGNCRTSHGGVQASKDCEAIQVPQ